MSPKNGWRALVVEDDPSWQQILIENLNDAGLEVDLADNLETALALVSNRPHRLAIVDLSLNEIDAHNQDGLQILNSIRRQDPGCKSILITGYATVELAVSVLNEYKALSCLRKEMFSRSQLRDLVKLALSSPPATEILADGQTKDQLMLADDKEPAEEENSLSALIVDDDAGWRSILSELLVDAGLNPRLCRSFGEALGLLRREKFFLAVVDLSLSQDNVHLEEQELEALEGYRLLKSARLGDIPTIVVSGISNAAGIEQIYQEQGIFAFIEKQAFDRKVFLQTVQEAIRRARMGDPLSVLSSREREVFDLLAKGSTNKEIASTLVISPNTVKRHLRAIFSKLGIHSRAAAAAALTGKSE